MRVTFLAVGSWDVALRELFVDLLLNPIYKATMGIGGHKDICWAIRLDDKRTRALWLKTDHIVPFRYVWTISLTNAEDSLSTVTVSP